MHLVLSYFLARLAEPSTRAALAAAAGALVAGALGQISWESAITGVATAAVPAFVPEGARGVLIGVAHALAEQRVRAEAAAKKGAILLLAAGLGLSACSSAELAESRGKVADVASVLLANVAAACQVYAPVAAGLQAGGSATVTSYLAYGNSVCTAFGQPREGLALDDGTAAWVGGITGALQVLAARPAPAG